ncbi:MAG: phosphate acyltransferase [Bacteroidota bacterium]
MKAIRSLKEIPELVRKGPFKPRIAVVVAEDDNTFDAVIKAENEGLIEPVLIGDENRIREMAAGKDLALRPTMLIHTTDHGHAARTGVAMIRNGEADILMKGLISSPDFLKAVLDKENGLLKSGMTLSYACALEIPSYPRLLIISDPAVLPYPSESQLAQMTGYAIDLAGSLGIGQPKIALIGANEKKEGNFHYSGSYRELLQLWEGGAFGDVLMDGPLDVFLACDPESVRIKGTATPVNGEADILIFPTLESCNPFYKGIMLFGGGTLAGYLQGTTHPVVFMSRSENFESKYYSIALAALSAMGRQHE